ncbi:MAG TPA: L-2-amino-thiazoline-4-carboxylic acid hydrolase [Bacillota bacterium]|jgi:hypothetical protein
MSDKAPDVLVTEEEATREVRVMARRLALFYHHMAETLTDRLGKDRAKTLLKEAVCRYGTDCGESVRKGVEQLGLPLTAENFKKVPDLPKFGWESDQVIYGGVPRPRVTYCPLAAVWHERGSQEMGRLYCFVDQAKYQSYNGLSCVHLKNTLDGDGYCLFSISESEPV